jgi:hypothetical protein
MKTTNYRNMIFSLAAKGGLLLAAVFALLPYSTKAHCMQWDVSGKWTAQVVKGASESLELKQSGNAITGKSYFYGSAGNVTGTVEGDTFDISIDWNTRERGSSLEFFHGKILPNGTIEGTAATLGGQVVKDKDNKWSSNRPMTCTARAPRVIKSTGRPKIDPAPNSAAEPSAKAPMISASPNNIAFVPGKIAHTLIRWDGGPDHPYAELWVKVDDQDEKFVIEQGKGSRQMVVAPGKTYLYILTDSGTRLATVTVKFHQ